VARSFRISGAGIGESFEIYPAHLGHLAADSGAFFRHSSEPTLVLFQVVVAFQ
jgi:hypothetical protein